MSDTDTKAPSPKTMVWVSGEQLDQIRELAYLRSSSIAQEVRNAIDMYLEESGSTKAVIAELEQKLKVLKASLPRK